MNKDIEAIAAKYQGGEDMKVDIKKLVRAQKIAAVRSFARQVQEMRDAQKSYFATRAKPMLDKSKRLEETVDGAIKIIIEKM